MKENSEFKPVKLRLKIDLVSYSARAEVLGKYDKGDSIKGLSSGWNGVKIDPSRKISVLKQREYFVDILYWRLKKKIELIYLL